MIMIIKGIIFTIILFLSICGNSSFPEQKRNRSIKKNNIPLELRNYYSSVDFSKKGMKLYEDLAVLTIEKHSKFLKYSERHKYLYKADRSDNNPEKIVLIYTGEERFWKEYEGNKEYSPNTFNTEHVYPRSKIITQAVTDLHHLRVCDSKVNNRRGNYPFTDGKGTAKLVNKSWFPGDEWKGDVARMVLYLNLRYAEELNEEISTGGIDLLLKWNAEDPVSSIEKNRNDVIQQAQGNRNPFIDNPYLATLIWGGYQAENHW
ncbi:endonuclease I family protein [Capnocytophaga stomatis]|uniref:endonuclease I family protein n=1 Tax=Capnocytophaga stomatis TaxID=1848904 RepID=UPI00385ADF8F